MKHRERFCSIVIVTALALTVATLAHAQIPDPSQSSATTWGGQIFICPAGDGQTLDEVGATITVTLLDATGSPVVDYPKENIRIASAVPGALAFCDGGNMADANTNGLGRTTFSGTLIGGGCTENGLQVTVDGVPLASPLLAIDVNSVDINGDLRADLCDLAVFVEIYFSTYSFCADFNHNNTVDAGDIAFIAAHFCSVCPDGGTPPTVTPSGEIGIFFDTAGTQTGIMGIEPQTFVDFYLVALSAPDGISAYQFGFTVDNPNVYITSPVNLPPGSHLATSGQYSYFAVPAGGCLQVTGPTVLLHFQAFVAVPVTEAPITLGPPNQNQCPDAPPVPAYISCLGDCDWRQFYPAYEGSIYINGVGPIATESMSWGRLKALFRN